MRRPVGPDRQFAGVLPRRRGHRDVNVHPYTLVLAGGNVERGYEFHGYGYFRVVVVVIGTVFPCAGAFSVARPGTAKPFRNVPFVVVIVEKVRAESFDFQVPDVKKLDVAIHPGEDAVSADRNRADNRPGGAFQCVERHGNVPGLRCWCFYDHIERDNLVSSTKNSDLLAVPSTVLDIRRILRCAQLLARDFVAAVIGPYGYLRMSGAHGQEGQCKSE